MHRLRLGSSKWHLDYTLKHIGEFRPLSIRSSFGIL